MHLWHPVEWGTEKSQDHHMKGVGGCNEVKPFKKAYKNYLDLGYYEERGTYAGATVSPFTDCARETRRESRD